MSPSTSGEYGYNRNNSNEAVTSPVGQRFPGIMDYQQAGARQFPIERKWALGLQSRAHPREIMTEVLKALQELNVCWKKIGQYNMKCRWIPSVPGHHEGMGINSMHGSQFFGDDSTITENDGVSKLTNVVKFEVQMTKEAIITDAITYIRELQTNVSNLTEQLLEMEAPHIEELETKNEEIIDAAEPEVEVAHIGTSKLWIKIVCQKKRGGFTKLMEAMNVVGFDLNDTSVTASKGTLLVTSSVEVVRGGLIEAHQIREILLEIIRGI